MATAATLNAEALDEDAEEVAYVPEGYEDAAEFLAEARELYSEGRDADRRNTEAAMDDLKFAAGDQWDPAEKALREELGQPCLTINTLPQLIGQVVGDWRANEVSIKVLPREDDDVDIAEVREDLIRSIESRCNAPQVYARAFEHEVTCGIGNFRIDLDYAGDDVFDRDIFIRPINNPLAVTWDAMSIDPTGKDAEHCFVEDVMPRRAFEKRWPKQTPSELGEKVYNDCTANGWWSNDTVRVTEYWQIVRKPRLLAMMQSGATRDVTDIDPDMWASQVYEDNGKPLTRIVQRKYAQMHFITGFAILEGPFELPIDRLPIIKCSGREVPIGDWRARFSLIRFAKDPQRLKNYWRSVIAEVLSKAPRQQWYGPADAFEGYETDFREAHLSGDPILRYKTKASAAPIPAPAAQVPAALIDQANMMSQDMKDTTGIQDASLGIKSNEVSGIAIQARQSQGDISTMIFTDNMSSSIMEGGSVVNQLIPVCYDRARTARLTGADGEVRLQRINDPMDPDAVDLAVSQCDVTISTGPAYLTRRQEAASSMMEAIRVAPQIMQVAGDLMAKAQDWPDADEIAERIKRTIPPQILGEDGDGDGQPKQPSPQEQQQMAMQTASMQAMQSKEQAEVMVAQAKVREANARADQAEAQAASARAEAEKAGAQVQTARADTATAFIKADHAHAELHAHHASTINSLSSQDAPASRNTSQTGNAPSASGRRPRRRK